MSGTEADRMNLENQIIPVSDVDRAKGFYEHLGWRFDDDVAPMDGLRSSSSLLRAQGPRSRSAWDCTRPRQARRRAPSSLLTSWQPMTGSSSLAST